MDFGVSAQREAQLQLVALLQLHALCQLDDLGDASFFALGNQVQIYFNRPMARAGYKLA